MVPAGTRAARFSLDAVNNTDDLDLYVYLNGDLIALSASGAADEQGTFIHQLQVTGLLMYHLAEHRGLREPVVVSVNNTSMAGRLGEHYGIAVGKNHKDILAGINGALKAIIADGEYKTIFKKYFPNNPVPPEYGG